jgi:hypothetical protein
MRENGVLSDISGNFFKPEGYDYSIFEDSSLGG